MILEERVEMQKEIVSKETDDILSKFKRTDFYKFVGLKDAWRH